MSLHASVRASANDAGLQRLLRLAVRLTGARFVVMTVQDAAVADRFELFLCGSEAADSAARAEHLATSPEFDSLHERRLAASELVTCLGEETAPEARALLGTLNAGGGIALSLAPLAECIAGTLWIFFAEPREWSRHALEPLQEIGAALVHEVLSSRKLRRQAEPRESLIAPADLNQTEARVNAFLALGQRLNAAATPREAAAIVLEVADQLLGWDACWLDLCDFDARQSQSILMIDLIDGKQQEVAAAVCTLTERSLCWRAASEGALLILHDEETSRRSLEELTSFGDLSRASASLLCVPIRQGSWTFGALSIQSYSFNAYTGTDLETLQALADYCAGTLKRTTAEAERRVLQSQLLQSQKMEAVGRLAGGVAHDFNNMLAVINGYAELMLMRWPPHSPDRSPMEEILKAGQRAAALTRQLLAFSRKQIMAPQVLDLAEAVMQTQKMLRRLIGADVELVTLPEPEAGRVLADPAQIDQILINLAVNARDAMTSGGKLVLRVSGETLTRAKIGRPDVVPAGRYVRLEATDTGCGIHPETLEHIFEPFFTTKPVGQGSGLGLATVLGTVKQNGGCIQVESELGRGTSFFVYLPALSDEAVAERAQNRTAPQGTETVLLVEDEEMLRGLLKSFLESRGYTVLHAAHGDEAIRLCREHGDVIQLLLTDVVMPVKGGRELADWVRHHHPHMRVLYMSGYTEDAVLRHGVEAEGAHFIQKPFATADLARKVREVLDHPRP